MTDEEDPRTRLLEALRRYPGLHLAELARQGAVEESLARYHVGRFVARGLATESGEGAFARYFPVDASDPLARSPLGREEKALVAALRRPAALRLVLVLLEDEAGRLPMRDLASRAGIGPSTATYHVQRLAQGGLVRVEPQGRERWVCLVDAPRLVELLRRYPPPRDVVQSFVALWDEVAEELGPPPVRP